MLISGRTIIFQCLVVVILLLGSQLYSQNLSIDSLSLILKSSSEDTNKVKILNELSWEYSFTDPKESIRYANLALSLSKELDFTKGISIAHSYLGRAYQISGDVSEGISHLKQSFEIDKKTGDKMGMAKVHNNLGSAYETIGNYDKALFHYYEGLKLSEELNEYEYIGTIQLNMSYVYFHLEEYENALKLSQEAEQIFKTKGDSVSVGLALSLAGMNYCKIGSHDLALENYQRALQIFIRNEDQFRVAEVLNSLGVLYQEKEEFEKAINYYQRALLIEDSLGNIQNLYIYYSNIGGVYTQLREVEKSIAYFEKAINLAKQAGELQQMMTTMQNASEAYLINNDCKQAYEYRLVYEQIKDSIYSEKKAEQFIKIQEEYNAEKREEKIRQLMHEKEAMREKAILRGVLVGTLIGILVLMIIILILYINNRRAKEQRRRIELEQRALRVQMNPHFIFNSLNSIQRMFIEGELDLAIDYVGDFGDLLRKILENSGMSYISIKNELDTLKLYLDLEIMRSGEMIVYELNIDPEIDQLNNFVPPLIIQPFVENAIWHGILPKGEKGSIVIELKKHDKDLVMCTITDDGIGIEKSKNQKTTQKHDSKGMKITAERLRIANSVKAEELESGGTRITILIPLKND